MAYIPHSLFSLWTSHVCVVPVCTKLNLIFSCQSVSCQLIFRPSKEPRRVEIFFSFLINGSRICHPKIGLFDIRIILNWLLSKLQIHKRISENSRIHSFKCIYFNWSLITLQYCSGFCHTLTWISRGCMCVPHLEPPYPHRAIKHLQCDWPQLRCTVSIKHTPGFKDVAWKKEWKTSQ